MQVKTGVDSGRRKLLTAGLLLFSMLVPGVALAQSSAMKSVQGRVLGSGDTPIQSAIVYLDDTKSNSIRSFISTQNGSYRFGQLSSDVDYKIWAEYKGEKSDTKAISSFNSRKNVVIDFHFKDK